ncbi:alpha/beta hydrolase [Candidatus Woesebacteria bacterium]|nr:alpha/beta hydrolase [Candidatus Woesebacteria bacterium]
MNKEAILIHGWDPDMYNSKILSKNVAFAWHHRGEFIKELKTQFNLNFYNLPGFVGKPEPDAKSWDIEDYAKDLASWVVQKKLKPKVIIGYSFGGAIALIYKVNYQPKAPIILISPAIVRQSSEFSELGRIAGKVLNVDAIKSLYQYLVSKYYREGTPFIRASYDMIVRRDLRESLSVLKKKDALFIYGSADESTPWLMVSDAVTKAGLKYTLIKGGAHNIGETHPSEITKGILDFMQNR